MYAEYTRVANKYEHCTLSYPVTFKTPVAAEESLLSNITQH